MTIEREKLYQLVWEKPISAVAAELGISGRGLSKLCHRHGIPTPPMGFWWREQEHTWNPVQSPSGCVPYHDTILEEAKAGRTAPRILERIKPLGYVGSITAINRYLAKAVKGRTIIRASASGTEYSTFVPARTRKSEKARPPLSPGEEMVAIKERVAPDGVTSAHATLPFGHGTLLEMIAPDLEFARLHDPEIFKAFWLEAGISLPAEAFTRLDWADIHTCPDGEWEARVSLPGHWGNKARRLTARVAPAARQALQGKRLRSGRVLKHPNLSRTRLGMILGPQWRTHTLAIRKALAV